MTTNFPTYNASQASNPWSHPMTNSQPPFGHPSGGPSLFASTTPGFSTSSTSPWSQPMTSSQPPFCHPASSPSLFASTTPVFSTSSVTSPFGQSPFGHPASSPSLFASTTPVFSTSSVTPPFGQSFGPQPLNGFVPAPNHGHLGGTRVVPYAATTDCDLSSGGQMAQIMFSISAMEAYKGRSHEELRWEDYCLGNKGQVAPVIPSMVMNAPSASSPAAQYLVIGPFYPLPSFAAYIPSSHFQPPNQTNIHQTNAANISPFASFFSHGNASASVPDATRATPASVPSTNLSTPFCQSSFTFNTSQSPTFGTRRSVFSQVAPPSSTDPARSLWSTPSQPFSVSSCACHRGSEQPSSSFAFNTSQGPSFDSRRAMFSQVGSTSSTASCSLFNRTQRTAPDNGNSRSGSLGFGFAPPQSTGSSQQISGHAVASTTTANTSSQNFTTVNTPFPQTTSIFSYPFTHQATASTSGATTSFFQNATTSSHPFVTTANTPLSQNTIISASPSTHQAVGSSTMDNTSSPQNTTVIASLFTHQPIASSTSDVIASVQNATTSASPPTDPAAFSPDWVVIPSISGGDTEVGKPPLKDCSLPKLLSEGYYMKPGLKELEAIERSQPGFCSRVMEFTVGRDGFGSIKFEGETDVRGLELDSLIMIKYREVSVTDKSPSGHGLNKAAMVTLFNIKCICKDTGAQHILGTKVSLYTEKLRKAIQDQGAEFLSYDPVNGECKFRVKHFPWYKGDSYKLLDEFDA